MAKLIDMSLEQLYAKEKITSSVEQAIVQKESFSKIIPIYCEKVCKLKCKSYENVSIDHKEVDVLIIQDHNALDDKWKSGQDIERLHRGIISELAKKNLKGLSYRVTNLVKCGIKKDDVDRKGKPPTSTVLMKCKPYLLEEIRSANPKVIISLTTNVTKALGLAKLSNYNNRGEIHNGIVITLHPKVATMIRQNSSGAMWGSDYLGVIDRDFNKAGRVARGELVVPSLEEALTKYRHQIIICETLEQVKEECEKILALPKNKIISFDLETTSLDPWIAEAKILTAQFGYRQEDGTIRAIVFTLWHKEFRGYNANKAWEYVKKIILSDLPKVGHNIKFDLLYCWATKRVRVQNIVFDTMLLLHAINSGIPGNYGLKRGVWDWLPETGLGGYEDRLPKLSKPKMEADEEEINTSGPGATEDQALQERMERDD